MIYTDDEREIALINKYLPDNDGMYVCSTTSLRPAQSSSNIEAIDLERRMENFCSEVLSGEDFDFKKIVKINQSAHHSLDHDQLVTAVEQHLKLKIRSSLSSNPCKKYLLGLNRSEIKAHIRGTENELRMSQNPDSRKRQSQTIQSEKPKAPKAVLNEKKPDYNEQKKIFEKLEEYRRFTMSGRNLLKCHRC
jgi:hypothetical protein